MQQYAEAFRKVEEDAPAEAKAKLKDLAENVSAWMRPGKRTDIDALVEKQISKLS